MGRLFKINNEIVSVDRNWNITDKINSRTTLTMTVTDIKALTNISIGNSVLITNDSIVIFSGIIRSITPQEKIPGVLEYQVRAVDNAALAEKRRVAKVYENILSGDIVKALIDDILSQEGVTYGTIEDGPIIKKAVFNYIKVSQALDYIKNITGLNWNIDENKQLNLFNREEYKAPFILNNQTQHSNFRPIKNMDEYRNVQYTRGGKVKTSLQEDRTPSPKPDGESKTFVVRFPIAEQPIIKINAVAVNPSDIGVNGLDINKKWYWSYNSNSI